MFVSFCMHYAGISADQIPSGSGCWAWQVKLEESDLLLTGLTVLPMAGDILLTDNDGDGKCDRAGVIIDVADGIISTIEGDSEGRVDTCSYAVEDGQVYGYVSVNSLEGSNPASGDTTVDETDVPEENEQASVFNAVTESGIEVRATAPEAAFPAGVTMSAADVDDEDIISQAEDAAGEDREIKGSIAVDITFTDIEGNETEPDGGFSVDVEIIIPEVIQIDADEYQLFHISSDGVENVSDAQVTGGGAAFTSESFSIFVVTALGEKDKDKVHEFLDDFAWLLPNQDGYVPNSAGFPYRIIEGETVILVGDYTAPGITMQIDNGYQDPECISLTNNPEPVDPPEEGHYRVSKVVTGIRPGEAKVNLMLNGAVIDSFYIRIHEKSTNAYNLDFISDWTLGQYQSPNSPMTIKVGDVINLLGNTDLGDRFVFIDPYGNIISDSNAADRLVQTGFTNNNDGTFVQTLLAVGNINSPIGVRISDRVVYFNIETRSMLDHADIEIADDGVFTDSRLYCEDGVIKKTVSQYQSFISDVNSCDLYYSEDTSIPATIYYGLENNLFDDVMGLYPGNVTGFVHDDYWQNPQIHPGSTQYELTSKYVKNEFGETVSTSRKQFFYDEINHVVFDVQIAVRPKTEETYYMVNGSWVRQDDLSVTYTPVYDSDNNITGYTKTTSSGTESVGVNDITTVIPSRVFEMGKRDVIDAFNKCPMNNGLDFTIRTDSANVELSARKELIGRDLSGYAGAFNYGIYEDENCSGTPVKTAVNTAAGDIDFDKFVFTAPGTKTYYVREIPGTDTDIKYDETVYKITIDVNADLVADISSFMKKDGSGNWVQASDFTFSNSVGFTLPDTGGGGIIPYLAVGTVLTGFALVLLMLRRRKEVDL